MECNLIWNHTRDFKIERARSASSIWNHKYDFRRKLHDTKFNCHFIRSILKLYNFIALIFRLLVYCFSSRFDKKKSGTGNAFTSHLVCKTMSCDENSSEHDKETSGFEVRTKIVCFRYKSSILVAWINDGRSFFLLWLRLRRFIVFGEGIWRCILRNSAMDFFWVVKLPRVHDAQWMVRFFSFIPFNGMILRESSSLSPPFLFVTSAKDSILRTLSSSCGAISFKIFPRWRD